jgi:arsenate reductase-like glutaredoxin family protein
VRTREVFERNKAVVTAERSARKEPFSDKEVRDLLKTVNTVVIAKGKKSTRFEAKKVKAADLKGPTGNYRAPIVKKGQTLVVGFSPDTLDEIL